jgi:tetratricopeptide (TPR) repeat protein
MSTKTLLSLALLAAVGCTPNAPPGDAKPKAEDAKTSDEKKDSAAPTKEKTGEAPTKAAGAAKKAAGKPKAAAKSTKEKPVDDKALTRDDRAAYVKALNDARDFHRKKSYAAAITAFDRALAIYPDDPRALSEKGWSEFFAKNLDAAERDTRDAIARTTDPALLGSSHYNLGRIQEERGEKDQAIASYKESLRVRPNKIVRERLAKLDAAAAAESGSFTAKPLAGPFAGLDKFCAAERKSKGGDYATFLCDAESGEKGELTGPTEAPAQGPYTAVKIFGSSGGYFADAPFGLGDASYYLAIKTKDGWYVFTDFAYVYNPGAFGIHESLEVTTLEIKDVVPGGAPEIVVRYEHSRGDSDLGLNEYQQDESEMLMVCGVGASGKPSCVGPQLLSSKSKRDIISAEDEAPGTPHDLFDNAFAMTYSFTPDGKLELKSADPKGLPEELKGAPTAHALTFP